MAGSRGVLFSLIERHSLDFFFSFFGESGERRPHGRFWKTPVRADVPRSSGAVESNGDVTTYIGIVCDDGPGYMGEAVADETANQPECPDDCEPYDIVEAEDVPWATK